LMAFFPVLILVVIVLFVIVAVWLVPKIARALRRLIARFRDLFNPAPAAVNPPK
jgi:flagellar biogenesis protein FliO